MKSLSINIDHIATLREARKGIEPDPVAAALLVELGGADGITVHLREDRRHIQDRDIHLLKEVIKTKLNLEMAATVEMQKIALDIKPQLVTIVPEKREELTTEGGLDVNSDRETLEQFIDKLHEGGLKVSLFLDPDPAQIKSAKLIGADYVEIHTGSFSEVWGSREGDKVFSKIDDVVKLASNLKLGVNAGHGLNYQNIKDVASIKEIEEFSIGHSIISRSVYVGLEKAVREMVELIKKSEM
ncbi:MAG: pyridoxine 5'-phosphate synthase [Thermodesulfobacteriota bacterium]